MNLIERNTFDAVIVVKMADARVEMNRSVMPDNGSSVHDREAGVIYTGSSVLVHFELVAEVIVSEPGHFPSMMNLIAAVPERRSLVPKRIAAVPKKKSPVIYFDSAVIEKRSSVTKCIAGVRKGISSVPERIAAAVKSKSCVSNREADDSRRDTVERVYLHRKSKPSPRPNWEGLWARLKHEEAVRSASHRLES